ncbi:MAG TPA: hypothetical protein VFV72_12540 [Candidatus Limnocylindrales bacterium]|nr:hypothetical protein [Candidatus Limnocylindrales bacterium]
MIASLPAVSAAVDAPRVVDAFRAMDRAGVTWAVLRGLDELVEARGDVDVLARGGSGAFLRSALAGAGFVEAPRRGRGSHRFFYGFDARRGDWVKVDVVDDLAFGRWAELDSGLAASALARRRQVEIPGVGRVWVLDGDDAAWAELLHLVLDPSPASPRRCERIAAAGTACSRADTTSPFAVWAGATDRKAAQDLVLAASQGRCNDAREAAASIRSRALRSRPAAAIARLARTVVRRRLARLPTPKRSRGFVVAVLGPDGAGKSALLERLAAAAPIPVRAEYLGAYPASPRDGGGQSGAPGGVPVVRFLRRLLRLWVAGVRGRIHARSGGLTLYDRHPIEVRLRKGGSVRRRLLRAAVPPPDLFLVLDAPASILVERKAEWPIEEIERQRAGYRTLLERPDSVRIDAAAPAAEVAREAVATIWAAYATRSTHDQARGAPETAR